MATQWKLPSFDGLWQGLGAQDRTHPSAGRWPLAAGRWPLAAGRWPLCLSVQRSTMQIHSIWLQSSRRLQRAFLWRLSRRRSALKSPARALPPLRPSPSPSPRTSLDGNPRPVLAGYAYCSTGCTHSEVKTAARRTAVPAASSQRIGRCLTLVGSDTARRPRDLLDGDCQTAGRC